MLKMVKQPLFTSYYNHSDTKISKPPVSLGELNKCVPYLDFHYAVVDHTENPVKLVYGQIIVEKKLTSAPSWNRLILKHVHFTPINAINLPNITLYGNKPLKSYLHM